MKTGLKENKWHTIPGAISNKICTNCPRKEVAGDRNHVLSTFALHIDLETSVSRNWAKLVECIGRDRTVNQILISEGEVHGFMDLLKNRHERRVL